MKKYKMKVISETFSAADSPHLPSRDADRTGGGGMGCSLSQPQTLSLSAMGLCLPGTGGAV